MKVSLVVVQGKPEGKVIPLAAPQFKIGRGETCHLRPNSELVSREHAEFSIGSAKVSVKDLGSRNGTLVNGKAITEASELKNGDLVQVGPLTFAVQIQGAPAPAPAAAAAPAAPAAKPAAAPAAKGASSLDEVSVDEIDSWLISDNANPTPDRPSGVYGGDTITISAFKDASNVAAKPAAPAPKAEEESDEEYERLTDDDSEESEDEDDDSPTLDDMPEDFIDESNPFYVAKKKAAEAATSGPTAPKYEDTSDAAKDILTKMMERRKAQKGG